MKLNTRLKLQVLNLGISIICIILLLHSSKNFNSHVFFLSSILDGWSISPISHLEMAELDCPMNAELLQIRPSSQGCDDNSDANSNEENNRSIPNGHAICIFRSPEFSYFSSNIKEKCTSDEKSCGIVDTLGKQLCIPPNKVCPILEKDLIRFLSDHSIKTKVNKHQNSNNLLVSVHLFSGSNQCAQPSRRLKAKRSSFSNEIDEVSFSNKPYIGWKRECFGKSRSHPDSVELIFHLIQHATSEQKAMFMISVVFFISLGGFLCWNLFLKRSNRKAFSDFVIVFFIIVVLITSLSLAISNQTRLEELDNPNKLNIKHCTDDSTQSKLEMIKEDIRSISVTCFFFCLAIILCLFNSIGGLLSKLDNTED